MAILQPKTTYGFFVIALMCFCVLLPSFTLANTLATLANTLATLANTSANNLPTSSQRFHRVDVPNLNALSVITAIVQDKQGFLWFGGKNGLVRFDGYKAVHYRFDAENPYSISANDISDLHVDQQGTLWVSFLSAGGVNRYDAARDRFIRYRHDPNDPHTIGSATVYAIDEDSQGTLWFATHGGAINRYDAGRDQYVRVIQGGAESGVPSGLIVRDIAVDANDHLWIATQNRGVFRWDDKTQELVSIPLPIFKGGLPEFNRVLVTQQGLIWLGTFRHGAIVLDADGALITHYRHDTKNATTIGGGLIWDIFETDDGDIWVATGGGDLCLLKQGDDLFQRFSPSRYSELSPTSTVTTIYADRVGDLWFGSYFSTIDHLSANYSLFNSLDVGLERDIQQWPSNIAALELDGSLGLWIGSDSRLQYYDFRLRQLTNGYLLGESFLEWPIRALHLDRSGALWLGTLGGGVITLQVDQGNITEIKRFPGLLDQKVWSIEEDSQGQIWVGTQNAGVAIFDRKLETFRHFPIQPLPLGPQSSGISNGFVWDIFEDSQKRLWIATQRGLNAWNPNNQSFTHFYADQANPKSLSSDSIRALAEGPESQLWVATDAGLNLLNPLNGEVTRYTTKNGLVDDHVSSLLVDGDVLWFSSQRGLSKLKVGSTEFHHYDARHGVAGGAFVRNTSLRISENILAFGGSEGVTLIFPDHFHVNTIPPEPVLTGFSIENKEQQPSDSGALNVSIHLAEEVVIAPSKRFFSLEFSALNFRTPSQNQFAYRLEGFDKAWQFTDAEHRRAVYTNLDAGTYRFLVKVSNNDGIWNEDPKSIRVIILPPWWQTWWAYTLFGLLITSALAATIQGRLNQIKRREIDLERLVKIRTEELAEANHVVHRLNEELEQRVTERTQALSKEVEERRHAEKKLYYMAFHDGLTDLPNRYWLIQELKKCIERSKLDDQYRFALFFLDGDRFKLINDAHGHLLGDQLLIASARRLRKVLPDEFHIARLGGDEFTILMDRVEDLATVRQVAQAIIQAFDQPFFPENKEVYFRMSVGVVICEELYAKPDYILRDADIALYRAKEKGRGSYQIFDYQMREESIERSELEHDLRSALVAGELELHYQPIVELVNGALIGFEALMRWRHPIKGMIPPSLFIPVAEESNLIGELGLQVLNLACEQIAEWEKQFPEFRRFSVAVNVSSLQMAQANLADLVEKTLDRWGIHGGRLKLEITESALMEHNSEVTEMLETFRRLGIELAIDDFGTGYSSLSYLDQLPVQVLKIDRSFVSGLSPKRTEGGALEIVKATISLAHNLSMRVVAEGIESKEQLKMLTELGCDYGQGFLFERALTEANATALLQMVSHSNGVYQKHRQPDDVLEDDSNSVDRRKGGSR